MTDVHGQRTVRWGRETLELEIVLADDGTVRMVRPGPQGEATGECRPGAPLPLVEMPAVRHGPHLVGQPPHRHQDRRAAAPPPHRTGRDGVRHTLTVEAHDAESGFATEVNYRSPDAIPALRRGGPARRGRHHPASESVSSPAVGCLTDGAAESLDAAELLWAYDEWLAKCRRDAGRWRARRADPDAVLLPPHLRGTRASAGVLHPGVSRATPLRDPATAEFSRSPPPRPPS